MQVIVTLSDNINFITLLRKKNLYNGYIVAYKEPKKLRFGNKNALILYFVALLTRNNSVALSAHLCYLVIITINVTLFKKTAGYNFFLVGQSLYEPFRGTF